MKKNGVPGEPLPGMPAALQEVVDAVGMDPGVTVEPGWRSRNVTVKVRGKIFAMSDGNRMVLKLPRARVDTLVASSRGRRYDPRRNGRLMKEWVVLSDPRTDWRDLAREALAFVGGGERRGTG